MVPPTYDLDVFINCPFDAQYADMFHALVFAVHDAGFRSRCALERSNAAETRIAKIMRIIAECRYGVDDISRTELDQTNQLPRFNMPLELGIFLGSHGFGDADQRRKACLVLDREPYRYQKFISDLAGQDVYSHGGVPEGAIREVCNWLRTESGSTMIPDADDMGHRFTAFQIDLPVICRSLPRPMNPAKLQYGVYVHVVTQWIIRNTP